jgi:glucokinase
MAMKRRSGLRLWKRAITSPSPPSIASCLVFGAIAGDVALTQGAEALVIAGGLGLRLADHLPRSGFHDRFVAKGRFEQRMREMPVKLITHPQPGLFGAAAAFADKFGS